jgi:hypothetical protein
MNLSTKKYIFLRIFLDFCRRLGTCSLSSSRDASSMSSSVVLPFASSCCSLRSTNARGLRVAPARNTNPRLRRESNCDIREAEDRKLDAENGRCGPLGAARREKRSPWRRKHARPKRTAVLILILDYMAWESIKWRMAQLKCGCEPSKKLSDAAPASRKGYVGTTSSFAGFPESRLNPFRCDA